MKAVGIKALKNQLSRYVQLARGGEVVLVLDRNEVVAELHPPGMRAEVGGDRWRALMASLEASNQIRPAREPGLCLSDLLPVGPEVPGAEGLIQGARDERL